MNFVVYKDESEEVSKSLIELLDKANVKLDFDRGPDFFDRYGFLIITMGLITVLFTLL